MMQNNANFMREYLQHATVMERYKYVWEQSLATANAQLAAQVKTLQDQQARMARSTDDYNNVDRDVAAERQAYAAQVEKDRKNSTHGGIWGTFYLKYFIIMGVVAVVAVVLLLLSGNDAILSVLPTLLLSAVPPILGVIVVVVGVSILYRKKYNKGNAHLNISHWDQEAAARKGQHLNAIAAQKQQIAVINGKIEVLQKNRAVIQTNLRSVNERLTAHYSMNVLPLKYRTLICVATMYDYLNTGRCTTVQGHGGIYDTYEYESRLNTIVTTLQEISSKLDTIIANQYTLYNEMQIANSHLAQIRGSLSDIAASNAAIAANTAATAVAAQQTAAIAQYESWRRRYE